MTFFNNRPGGNDLRQFISLLEEKGQLKRINKPIDPDLELAAITNRVIGMGGPGLLFENVIGSSIPVAVNLLGTIERVAWSMGLEKADQLEELGEKLSLLQQPKPPKGLKETFALGGVLWDLIRSKPDYDLTPTCHQEILKDKDVDLDALPLIRPWPKDAAKIITLGLVITKDPETKIPNVGIYRLQKQSPTSMTVHWLSVRGGARHLRKAAELGKKLEVAVAIGVHPLVLMAAATPIPIDLSEWLFAGLYAGQGIRLTRCKTLDIEIPSDSEIVLEGTITPGEEMIDGPCGDHMGFYGGKELSPLINFHCITKRKNPIYLTTFSGRPPKEEAILAIALNRIYTPILRRQVTEIVDFYLPMEALSYKLAIISIDKSYPGHAKKAAMAFWSALPQFTYTKFIVIVDKNINVRDPRQVVWSIASQVDPKRDLVVIDNSPFDSLDFASEYIGLGGRLAIDATTKIGPEKTHDWGESLEHSDELIKNIESKWTELGLSDLKDNEPSPELFGYVIDELIKIRQVSKS